jgi:hypothetical protein
MEIKVWCWLAQDFSKPPSEKELSKVTEKMLNADPD